MGFGTTFTTEVYLNRKIFNSKYELDDKIKEIKNFIDLNKKELLALAVSTPKDVFSSENKEDFIEHPLDMIINRVNEILESLDDYYFELNGLYMLKEYLNENPDVDISKLNDLN